MSILDYSTKAAAEDESVVNLTNRALQVIPHGGNRPCVKLVFKGNQIILNETDRLALATYSGLAELHLDSNLVTVIPAKYFSVVPDLRVLHLSRNNISRLDPEAFSGLDDLVELDLSHNLLEVLDSNTTDNLGHLRSLDLQENPWNCSCLLLHSIGELNASGVAIDIMGKAQLVCWSQGRPYVSSQMQVVGASGARGPVCLSREASWWRSSGGYSYMLPITATLLYCKTTTTNITSTENQTPVLGNTWKFTLCVAAIALSTSMVIVCAIKWPTWHKLLSSYRHQRLREEDNEEEEVVPGHRLDAQQPEMFTYGQENGRAEKEEEEEDGYIEDLYIERADYHAGGGKGYSSAATEEEA
uniref:leucine-rich repeat-containing protein 19-like n=1 Tax=Centroberyx gerrardi TaxID=166262 RepID=UPI003AAD3D63